MFPRGPVEWAALILATATGVLLVAALLTA